MTATTPMPSLVLREQGLEPDERAGLRFAEDHASARDGAHVRAPARRRSPRLALPREHRPARQRTLPHVFGSDRQPRQRAGQRSPATMPLGPGRAASRMGSDSDQRPSVCSRASTGRGDRPRRGRGVVRDHAAGRPGTGPTAEAELAAWKAASERSEDCRGIHNAGQQGSIVPVVGPRLPRDPGQPLLGRKVVDERHHRRSQRLVQQVLEQLTARRSHPAVGIPQPTMDRPNILASRMRNWRSRKNRSMRWASLSWSSVTSSRCAGVALAGTCWAPWSRRTLKRRASAAAATVRAAASRTSASSNGTFGWSAGDPAQPAEDLEPDPSFALQREMPLQNGYGLLRREEADRAWDVLTNPRAGEL